MTLREEINELVKELSEWYIEELQAGIEALEDKGVPVFQVVEEAKEAEEPE